MIDVRLCKKQSACSVMLFAGPCGSGVKDLTVGWERGKTGNHRSNKIYGLKLTMSQLEQPTPVKTTKAISDRLNGIFGF